jgi:hypothetical protein
MNHSQCKIRYDSYLSLSAVLLFAPITTFGAKSPDATPKIDFNRDIRPIFSEHCYTCHGPDDQKRKAGLRLDVQDDAFKELKSGNHALVPGDLGKSAMIGRITSTDPDEVMPPPKHNKPLKPEQIALIKQWVQEGAQWKKHWSFIPPERPSLPAVKDRNWPRNAIDYFTLARLEKENLKPNPEAEKATLIRRVSFDLTGLPPTITEVDDFLADKSPRAYENLVERLLASPHYGERMAQNWLDLARFADTSGYHFDGVRFLWLWRDWVIKAFNDNKPYDEFTVEQLAGDLLPKPTISTRVATGFVRNNMTNDEGGADPDEYLNEYVVDRVNTLGVVWLGLTVGCTQCHDHKYDPLKTKEFYRLYAFFHNVPEKGLDRIRTDNPPPRLPIPTQEQAMKFVEADFALKDAEKTLQDRINELGETQEKWERLTSAKPPPKPHDEGLLATIPFEGSLAVVISPETGAEGKIVEAEKPDFEEGFIGKALKLDGKAYADFGSLVGFDRTNAFSYGAWVKLEGDGAVLSKMEKGPGYRGFDLFAADERFQVHLANAWPNDALKVKTKDKFPKNQWLHLLATYDGSGKAAGVKLYVNGRARELETEKDQLTNSIASNEPLRIGARNAESVLKGRVDDVRLYDRALSSEDVRLLAFNGYLPIILKSRGNRSEEERSELQKFYKENYAVDYLFSEVALAEARKRKEEFYTNIPTTQIMEEMNPPRDTFVLVRGDFRNKGEKVSPGTPAVLPPLPEGPTNRLTLARWLVSKEHPLMARVTVNRYWSMFFGTGLVKTQNDFGSQGEWPSHPELLDWLAVQFRDGGEVLPGKHGNSVHAWDVKGLVRLMVTSATYRQSAAVTSDKLERDPYNRLFTRGPRVRLDAEFIRDNALAVSGLLNDKIGGPSVKPYQPPGIWDGVDAKYEQDKGDSLYRRGMYVFWRRSAHYPSFATFDAPSREVCTCTRQRTQTPLQSLVLMNDPVYVEAARGLAERVLKEEPKDSDRRLLQAFRHTLGRMPEPDEVAVLHKTYEQQLEEFREKPESATQLIKVGESPAPQKMDSAELAAMTAVANVLLNLNETITK